MLGGCGGLSESEAEAYEAQETARLEGKYGTSADTQAVIAAVAQLRRSAHTHWRIASELDARAESVETALLAAAASLNRPPPSSSSSSSTLSNPPSSPLFNNSILVSPLSSTSSSVSASAAARTLASQLHKSSSQKHGLSYADFINTQHNRASRARANDSFWSQQTPSSNKPPPINTSPAALLVAHTPESRKQNTNIIKVKRVRSLSVIQAQPNELPMHSRPVAPLPPTLSNREFTRRSTQTLSAASSGPSLSKGVSATPTTEDIWIQRSLSHNNKRHSASSLSYAFSPAPVPVPALPFTYVTARNAPDNEHFFKSNAEASAVPPPPRVDPLPELMPQKAVVDIPTLIGMRRVKSSLPASGQVVGIGQNGSVIVPPVPAIPSNVLSTSNSFSNAATGEKGVQRKSSILGQWKMRNPFVSK